MTSAPPRLLHLAGAGALSAALGLSCGSPPPPPPPAVSIPTSKPAPEAADSCRGVAQRMTRLARTLRGDVRSGAPGLVRGDALTRYLAEWPPWCARSLFEKTRAECPDALDEADPALKEALSDPDDRRKAARFWMDRDGRLLVESAGVHPVVRVFETSPDGPRLRWVLAPAEGCTPIEAEQGTPARVICHVTREQRSSGDDRQYLLVLDTGANKVLRFNDVEGYQRLGARLVLASSRRVRSIDWATLEVISDVPKPNVDYAHPFHPEVLAGGKTALLSDTLVALDTGAVLAGRLEEPGWLSNIVISAGREKLVACKDQKLTLVDARTGQSRPLSGPRKCGIAPVFAPDGLHLVGAEQTAGTPGAGGRTPLTLVPFVSDVATGKVTSFPAATFRASRRGDFRGVYFASDEPSRACLSYAPDSGKGILYYGEDPDGDACPFEVDAAFRVSQKPRLPGPFASKKLGLAGIEVARAARPDKGTHLLAMAKVHGGAAESQTTTWDITIAEVGNTPPHVLRKLQITTGDLAAGGLGAIPYVDYGSSDGIVFLSADRAVLKTSPPLVVDLAADKLAFSEGDYVAGRWAISSAHDALLDLLGDKRFPLEPDRAAWQSVMTYGADCPASLSPPRP